MRIFKAFTLEAAHRLPNLPCGHKCSRLHGHSYRIEIHVEGQVEAQSGWVTDFAEVKKAFQPIYEQLDHGYLNEIEGLENPTCEVMARWIWKRLKPSLPSLARVAINETATTGCVYEGEDD